MAEANSGIKGGECIDGTVIGKEETVTNTYKAPGKVTTTEFEGCSKVTKFGDIHGKSIIINSYCTGSKNVSTKTKGMPQVTEKTHRKSEDKSKAGQSISSTGMSGGVLRKGKVIGTQRKEDNVFEESQNVNETRISNCTNVTDYGDIEGETVSIGAGGGKAFEEEEEEEEMKDEEESMDTSNPQGHGHYYFKGSETVVSIAGLQAKNVNINNTTKSEQPTKRHKREDKI